MAKATRHRKRLQPENKKEISTPELSKTVGWEELPSWQKDNEHILFGYRRVQYSWRGCLISVFSYLHNETVNIHSHLWGAILFIYFLGTFYPSHILQYSTATWKDSVMFAIFLSSAIFCLVSSTLYHTSGCHSEKVARRCHAYDYSGIVVLTVGSFFPSIYYGFFCHSHWQALYLISMTCAGIGAAYIVLNPEYSKPTHRGARTAVFIALGLCAVAPVSHLMATRGANELLMEMGFGWLITSGVLYIGGALLYANRAPERFAPGCFDYFFASHQIFHVCVVLAALAHYKGVLTCMHYHREKQYPCSA